MSLLQQLKIALFHAPSSLLKLKRNSLHWMIIYCLSGIVIFGLFVWLMISNQVDIKNALLNYLFPQSWHGLSETLADFLFESQTKSVISNAILSGSLIFASIFLFPIKEKYSAEFEKEAKLNNVKVSEFPLIDQAGEEIKLFLIYLTAQSIILFIGYYPYQWTSWISMGFSYLFLFFTFGLDFISPTLQRHRTRYSLILKMLIKKPLLVISFGAFFSLPAIMLSRWVFSFDDLTLIEISSILFLTNIIFLTLAIPAGTRIASDLLPLVQLTLPPRKKSVVWSYAIMSILLTSGLFLHSQLVVSLHHKSQLLKAKYEIDWSSIDYEVPSLSQLVNGKALSNLSFDMVVTNPTEYDIVIEESQMIVEQKEKIIATIDLSGFELLAGKSQRINIQWDSNSDLSQVSNFGNLLEDWRIDLHLQIWPGIPFVFNLVEP